jgi:DNA-binding CsgD family transcriptional regulator
LPVARRAGTPDEIAHSTVRVLLARAARKLRARSRRELVSRFS